MSPIANLFIDILGEAGFNVSALPVNDAAIKVRCLYKNNPDGSVRWIWPAGSRRAEFLRFYHTGNTMSKFFSVAVNTLFRLGLEHLFSDGSFNFFVSGEKDFAFTSWSDRWAYFAGTIGPNQKACLWQKTEGLHHGRFMKIALTERSQKNLLNEGNIIAKVRKMQLPDFRLPSILHRQQGVLTLADIGDTTKRTDRIGDIPTDALQRWLLADKKEAVFADSPLRASITQLMNRVEMSDDKRFSSLLLTRLRRLYAHLSTKEMITTSWSHGDFTPWNTMMSGSQLHVIDWELARPDMPVLFDLFHFTYQSNILIRHGSYKAIRSELDKLFTRPDWKSFLDVNQISTTDAESWYLLYNVLYHLDLYNSQQEWHSQISWLLECWESALTCQLAFHQQAAEPRKLLLQDLQAALDPVGYAILKWCGGPLESLSSSSDLDICIARKDECIFTGFLQNHVLVTKVECRSKSFMKQIKCVLTDGNTLHIDLIYAFKRKSVVFLDAGEVLAFAEKTSDGVKVPAIQHDFTYTWLFFWLNHSAIPERYQKLFTFFEKEKTGRISTYIKRNYLPLLTDYRDLFDQHPDKLNFRLPQKITLLPANKGVNRIINYLNYLKDAAKEMLPQKGLVITFSGVDGAGKSTVIENIRVAVEKKSRRKVVVLRHRPSLLPILSSFQYGKNGAEIRSMSSLPRNGNNKGLLSSLLRFTYYYTDYFIGQLYIQVRYVWRGYVVLYDRYYFDFINDARRSNIELPSGLSNTLYFFLLKPRLNFFLYAEVDEILRRKKELEPAVINILTSKYLDLFKKFSSRYSHSKYIPVLNNSLPDTLQVIYTHIQNEQQ